MSQPTKATASPSRAASTASAASTAPRRRPLKATDTVSSVRPLILAVEPDERTRSLLEVGFAEQGFTLVAAASAEEAQGYLRPEWMLPAMIFCDADLRGEDGFSLCGQIRADPRTTDLPVVLLSKTPDAFHREMAGGVGADQLLPKPIFLNDLVAMARLMAGRSSSGARYDADTANLPLPQVLRALLSGVRSGRLDFHPGPAWISFREGQVVDAAYEGLRGEEALRRMLLLARGSYVVAFGPTLSRATMTFGVEELCGQAYARFQRWEKLIDAGLSLDAVWTIDFERLSAEHSTLPGDVGALVQLFDGKRTVRDALLKSRVDELFALEAVGRLIGIGILVPHDRESEAARGVSRVRALFQRTEERAAEEAGQGDGSSPSLYESTGMLDKRILQQLAAFRIRPVVEHVSNVPASPELTSFVRKVDPPEPQPERQQEPQQEPQSSVGSARIAADALMLDESDLPASAWWPSNDRGTPAADTAEKAIGSGAQASGVEGGAEGLSLEDEPPRDEESLEDQAASPTIEPATGWDAAESAEPPVGEESSVGGESWVPAESPVEQERSDANEPSLAAESSLAEESSSAAEPSLDAESPVADESSFGAESSFVPETPVAEESSFAAESPDAEEPSFAAQSPVAEESSFAAEEPVAAESPANVEPPVAAETASPAHRSTIEESWFATESPVAAVSPAPAEPPIAAEPSVAAHSAVTAESSVEAESSVAPESSVAAAAESSGSAEPSVAEAWPAIAESPVAAEPVTSKPAPIPEEAPRPKSSPEPLAAPPLPTVVIAPSLTADARKVETSRPTAPPIPSVVISPTLVAEARKIESSTPPAPPAPTVLVSPALLDDARRESSVSQSSFATGLLPASPRAAHAAPRPARQVRVPVENFAAPAPLPDRKWLLVGVLSTALVAMLAGVAVIVTTRPPPWFGSTARPVIALNGAATTQESPVLGEPDFSPAPPAAARVPSEPAPAAKATPAVASVISGAEPAAASKAPAEAAAPSTQPTREKDDGDAALARGVRLYETGRHREAIRVLEDVTRNHPNLATAWVYLGMAKFDRGDRSGAERAAKKALALEPKNGRALMLLATVHLDAGDTRKAKAQLRRYLELYPNGPYAREARQLLGRR